MILDNKKFENRHVLYCDLLGFSVYINSIFFEPTKCFRLFGQLDRLLEDACREIDPSQPEYITGQVPTYVVKPEAIYCSDSIIISTPATNIDAIWLCEAAARIQTGVSSHGFLIRGGITTGLLYHSGNTIFGPAIVEAAAMDVSGGMPKINISDKTLDFFRLSESAEGREIVSIRERQLIAVEDEVAHIEHFWPAKNGIHQEKQHPRNKMSIETWRALIVRGLKSKHAKTAEKYLWIAKRFNHTLCNGTSKVVPILHSEIVA